MALTHTDLHLRQQQQHAAGRHQAYHHLQRPADLGEHLADLTQDGADIQQTDGGKLAVQLGQHRGTVIPAEAGEPALRLPVQRPGGENKEEVWPQLSQSTLRTLLTFALNSWVSPVKVTVSPIFIPSRCASPSSIDTSPGFGGQLPATSGL